MSSLLSLKEVANLLSVSVSTVRRHGLPCYKIGGKLMFKEKEVDDWISDHKRNALTALPLFDINKAEGGQSELGKKKPTCFNYGFGRVRLRKYKSGRRCWTISYYDEDGKRIQKAAPQAQTKEEAALALQQEVQKAFDRKHGIQQKRGKIGFTAFSKPYLQDYAMIAKRSWKTDAYSLKILNEFFKDIELREITPLMIQKFRAWRLREGNAKSTCNRYLALLKRMFTIGIGEGYLEHNPAKKIKLFSEKDLLRERILSPAEEKKLLEESAEHLRPIIILALNTGMRRAEILNLKWNQVDFKARRIEVVRTKSGKTRFIPVNDVLFHELNTLRVVSDKSPLVFSNPKTGEAYVDMKKGFKAACRRAKIEGMRFHDLRHCFASRLIEFGADIGVVRELLGHSSIAITERYIHSNDDRKRAAVELLSDSVRDKICDAVVTQGDSSKLIH